MTKAILIILTLAGFASGAEMEVTDRLSVDGSPLLRGTVTVDGSSLFMSTLTVTGAGIEVRSGTSTAYSLTVGTSANYSFSVSTGGAAQFSGTISRGTHTVLDDSMLDSFTLKFDTATGKIGLADRVEQNIMLDAFKIAVSSSLSKFNMVDGIMDEFEDESGVDKINSSSQTYNPAGQYYSPLVSQGGIDSNTKLLLHFNGTDGQTTYTSDDVNARTVTFVSTAKLATAQKEFGSASLFLNGSSDYVTVPDSDDWDFGTGDFTIDFWFNRNNWTGNKLIFDMGRFLSNYGIAFLWDSGYNPAILSVGFQGAYLQYASGDPNFRVNFTVGTWYHLALTRAGTSVKVFINGVQLGMTNTNSADIQASNYGITIGAGQGGAYFAPCYIDEFRVSKGIARWTTNFTPSVAEYTLPSTYNMVLVSTITTAMAVPSNARLVLFEEDVDTVTINSDMQAYVTGKDTTSWTQVSLADEGNYQSGRRILSGMAGIAAASTGTAMRWKVETHNNRNLKLHGVGLNWD